MAAARQETEVKVIREGWCVKESGDTFMGQHNWRKRWFLLMQKGEEVTLSYYRNKSDKEPAGSVRLDKTYCTRELELAEKNKAHCFAVGPLIDNGAVRTYFISCESEQDKLEWMVVIDATIEGVPERAEKRRQTIALKQKQRSKGKLGLYPTAFRSSLSEDIDSIKCKYVDKQRIGRLSMTRSIPEDNHDYMDPRYRLEKWHRLCLLARQGPWKKIDTKDDVTIARFTFKDQSMVVIKIEGLAKATRDVVFTFLQRATRQGGKLDYPFRNETVLQELEGDPPGTVFYREYPVPLPRISPRLVCGVRSWIPEYCTPDGTSGLLVFSADHPGLSGTKGTERVAIEPSGFILTAASTPDGEEATQLTVVAQLDVQGTLQRMLRGAYKSGLLKIGIRSGFQHICQQLARQMEIFNM